MGCEAIADAEIAARMVFRLDGVKVAPPQITIGAPVRMQSLHSGLRAPERHAMDHQPLAITVEQLVGAGAAQSLVNRPDMRIDDVAAERSIERVHREPRRWNENFGVHDKPFGGSRGHPAIWANYGSAGANATAAAVGARLGQFLGHQVTGAAAEARPWMVDAPMW
jgi:hypothetical protein